MRTITAGSGGSPAIRPIVFSGSPRMRGPRMHASGCFRSAAPSAVVAVSIEKDALFGDHESSAPAVRLKLDRGERRGNLVCIEIHLVDVDDPPFRHDVQIFRPEIAGLHLRPVAVQSGRPLAVESIAAADSEIKLARQNSHLRAPEPACLAFGSREREARP